MLVVMCATHVSMLIACCRMVADEENPLVLDILHADSSAYSFNPNEPVEEVC